MGGDVVIGADPVRDPAGGELHGHHQGLRPHRRGRRAVQPRCDARQADGDRRRPLRRPDRREGSAPPPRELEEESGFYGAMDGAAKFVRGDAIAGADHHRDQHRRRPRHRPAAARHAVRRRRGDLHHADRRRRPGLADPGAAGLHRRRHRGDQGRHGGHRRRGADPPARAQPEAAGDGGRRRGGAGADARAAGAAVPGAGRPGRQAAPGCATSNPPVDAADRDARRLPWPPSSRSATRCAST